MHRAWKWAKTCSLLSAMFLAAIMPASAASGDQPGPHELTLPSSTLPLDPYKPMILATSDTPLPKMQVSVPEHVTRGSVVNIAARALPAQADVSIFHVEIQNPEEKRMISYSRNVIVKGESGVRSIPLAVNDAQGKWTVVVRDVMSGQSVTRYIEVR